MKQFAVINLKYFLIQYLQYAEFIVVAQYKK